MGTNHAWATTTMATRGTGSLVAALAQTADAVRLGPLRTSVRDRPRRIRACNSGTPPTAFATFAQRRADDRVNQRYGTANEPPRHFAESQPREGRGGTTDAPARQHASAPAASKKQAERATSEEHQHSKVDRSTRVRVDTEAWQTGEASAMTESANGFAPGEDSSSASRPDPPLEPQQAPPSKSLETVLNMPPPENMEADRPPQLHAPPYVHHFDTYGLVQRLHSGGFTNDQSTTIMKAVRTILADNMDLARRGLVSKSNVENETYLFKAACSELKTEIQNTRKKNEETMRRERTLLQHEVDILSQKLSQELLILRDDLKGMFDDRKMSVRMEQRTMESKIQELNYK